MACRWAPLSLFPLQPWDTCLTMVALGELATLSLLCRHLSPRCRARIKEHGEALCARWLSAEEVRCQMPRDRRDVGAADRRLFAQALACRPGGRRTLEWSGVRALPPAGAAELLLALELRLGGEIVWRFPFESLQELHVTCAASMRGVVFFERLPPDAGEFDGIWDRWQEVGPGTRPYDLALAMLRDAAPQPVGPIFDGPIFDNNIAPALQLRIWNITTRELVILGSDDADIDVEYGAPNTPMMLGEDSCVVMTMAHSHPGGSRDIDHEEETENGIFYDGHDDAGLQTCVLLKHFPDGRIFVRGHMILQVPDTTDPDDDVLNRALGPGHSLDRYASLMSSFRAV